MSGVDSEIDLAMLKCTPDCTVFSTNIYQAGSSCLAQCPTATPFFDSSRVCVSSCIAHPSEKFISDDDSMLCTASCTSGYYWMDDDTGFLYCLDSCSGSNKSAIVNDIHSTLKRCAPRCVDVEEELAYFDGSSCVTSCPSASAYFTSDGICVS